MTVSLVPAQKLGLPIVSVDGAFRLLLDKRVCHGYQNCCGCDVCRERKAKPLPAPEPVRQPWDVAAA